MRVGPVLLVVFRYEDLVDVFPGHVFVQGLIRNLPLRTWPEVVLNGTSLCRLGARFPWGLLAFGSYNSGSGADI